MLHPLPLPLSSCLGCIPPLIGLPSLRFYAVGSSLFLLSVCFCLCSLFYRDDVLCWLLLARPFLYAFHAHLRFPVDLVWFRLSCDHGWIRSGSVNVRKQQQQQQQQLIADGPHHYHPACGHKGSSHLSPVHTLQLFYRDASAALLQLVNQRLNFTYSRSHAFRYERKNTNPTLVRIELTTSVLADVQLTY